jgi:O-antigen/teichoic acid export membrane protein
MRSSENHHSLYLLLAFGGIGALVLFALSVFFSRRILSARPRLDTDIMKRLLKLCAPYGIAFLCTALYRQFDVTMIGLLRPQDYELQNAFYGFVQRMMDMAYLLPTFLLNSTLPILSERSEAGQDTREFLGKVLFAILLLGSTSLLFASLWPKPLMRMLTTEQYLSTATSPGSDTALRLLSVSMFCNGLLTFSFYVLLTRHRWKPLVTILLIGVVTSLTCNALLIPKMGFVGASITSIVTHALLSILLLPLSLRTLPARLTRVQAGQWLGFSASLLLFLLLTRPLLTHPIATAGMLLAGAAWMALSAWLLKIHRSLAIV